MDNHRDALEYELIKRGARLRWLGTPFLSWRDVYLIAINAEPGSQLARELDPSLAWTRTDYWLQSIEYSLRWLVWGKTKDAQHNRKRPKPVEPPAKKQKAKRKNNGPRMSKKALREYLARPRISADGTTPVVHRLPDRT